MAAPWMAPTTGFLLPYRRAASRYSLPVVSWKPSSEKSELPSSPGWPLPKLAPAQNDLPCAASTMARQLGSSSRRSKASATCSIRLWSKKLCGGR